jgi:hypothetical protein
MSINHIYLSIYPSIISIYHIYLPIYLSYLSTYLSFISIYLSGPDDFQAAKETSRSTGTAAKKVHDTEYYDILGTMKMMVIGDDQYDEYDDDEYDSDDGDR